LVRSTNRVEEVVDEHISFAFLLIDLIKVLNFLEDRVVAQVKVLVELKTVKSFVSFHFSKSVFLVRALRNNGASLVNTGNSIAESVKLSQSSSRDFATPVVDISIRVNVSIFRVEILVADNVLSFSHEVCVEFSKDFGVGDLSSVEFTELPGGVGAPVVHAFGELILLSNIVDTDGDEVVVLNS